MINKYETNIINIITHLKNEINNKKPVLEI